MSKNSKMQQIRVLLSGDNRMQPSVWLFKDTRVFDGISNDSVEFSLEQFEKAYNPKTDLMIFFTDSQFTEKYSKLGRCIILYSSK